MADGGSILDDPKRVLEVVRAIESIERAVSNLDHSIVEIGQHIGATGADYASAVDRGKRGAEELRVTFTDTFDQLSGSVDEAIELSMTPFDRFAESVRNTFRDIAEEMDRIERHPMTRLFDSMTDKFNQVGQNPAGFMQGMLSQLPFGLGALAQVGLRGSTFTGDEAARGMRMAAPFMQTGADMGQLRGGQSVLAGESRRLIDQFVAQEPEIQNVINTLVKGGATIEQALSHAGTSVKGFGDRAFETLLGLDRAMQQPAGTFANILTEVRRDTGATFTGALDIVRELGGAAVASGLDFQSFAGSITQVTSALRVQGGDTESAIRSFLNLKGAMQGLAPGGMESARAGQLAALASSDIASTITGLPEGLKAIIGRAVGSRHGLQLSDVGGINAMNTGFQFALPQGERGNVQAEVMSALAQYFRGQFSGDTEEFTRALQVAGNLPPLLANVVARMGSAEFLGDNTAMAKAMKDFRSQQDIAHTVQSLQTGDFEKAMLSLERAVTSSGALIASVVGALIGVTSAGFVAVGQAVTQQSSDPLIAYVNTVRAALGDVRGEANTLVERLGPQFKSMGPFFDRALGGKYIDMQAEHGRRKSGEDFDSKLDAAVSNYMESVPDAALRKRFGFGTGPVTQLPAAVAARQALSGTQYETGLEQTIQHVVDGVTWEFNVKATPKFNQKRFVQPGMTPPRE